MTSPRATTAFAAAIISLLAIERAGLAQERPPVARFTADVLAGTGYGWSKGLADVNRDIAVDGGGWARLGHVIVEGGVLFPRARIFVLTGPRYQVITGTTDVYVLNNFVAHARSSAFAWFSKIGWQLRPPEARVQPYLALSSGYGTIAHIARLPSLTDCGPSRDQTCVDTVAPELLFFGWGAGVRVRLAAHLEAVLALENQFGVQADFLVDLFEGRGFEERTFNFDANVGLAAVF